MKLFVLVGLFLLLRTGNGYERKSKKDEDTSLFKLLSSDTINKQISKANTPTVVNLDENLIDTKPEMIDASAKLSMNDGISIAPTTKDSLQDILSKIQATPTPIHKPTTGIILGKEVLNASTPMQITGEKAAVIEKNDIKPRINPDLENHSPQPVTGILPTTKQPLSDIGDNKLTSGTGLSMYAVNIAPPKQMTATTLPPDELVEKLSVGGDKKIFPNDTAQHLIDYNSKLLANNVSPNPAELKTPPTMAAIISNPNVHLPNAPPPLPVNVGAKLQANGDNTQYLAKDESKNLPGKDGEQGMLKNAADTKNYDSKLTLHVQTDEETEAMKREKERHEAMILSNPKPKTEDNPNENIDIKILKAFAKTKGKLKTMENLASIEENVLMGKLPDDAIPPSQLYMLSTNGTKNSNLDLNDVSDNPTTAFNRDVFTDISNNGGNINNTAEEKYPIIIINADENEKRKMESDNDEENSSSRPFQPVSTSDPDGNNGLSEEELLNRKLSYLKDKLRHRKMINRMHELELSTFEKNFHTKNEDFSAVPPTSGETQMEVGKPNDVGAELTSQTISPPNSPTPTDAPYKQLVPATSHAETSPAQMDSTISHEKVSPIQGDTGVSQGDTAKPQENVVTSQADASISQGDASILKNDTDVGFNRGTMSHGAPTTMFSFSYDPKSPFGPPSWQLLNPEWTCKSRKQSPINIETDRVMNEQIIKNVMVKIYPPGRPISGILKNNGHAPTLSLSSEIAVKLFGGTLINDYFLRQLHFHFGCDSATGSEHRIDGENFPLELHLVFWDNTTYPSFTEAAKSDRGIAVISVLYQSMAIPLPEVRRTPLSQFSQLLRHIEEEGDNITVTSDFNFRLEKIIPNVISSEHADKVFTYEGSLTTPGCYESVTWIVFASHPPVTEGQMRIFRALKSTKVNSQGMMCNNSRPLQNKNGRRIYSNIVT